MRCTTFAESEPGRFKRCILEPGHADCGHVTEDGLVAADAATYDYAADCAHLEATGRGTLVEVVNGKGTVIL